MKWSHYRSAKDLEAAVEQFFAGRDQENKLYGEAGLALALNVSLQTLRAWYDGREHKEFQPVIRRAYLRIQDQIESSPLYQERSMGTRANMLLKQNRLGAYAERGEGDVEVRVLLGDQMEKSDFL